MSTFSKSEIPHLPDPEDYSEPLFAHMFSVYFANESHVSLANAMRPAVKLMNPVELATTAELLDELDAEPNPTGVDSEPAALTVLRRRKLQPVTPAPLSPPEVKDLRQQLVDPEMREYLSDIAMLYGFNLAMNGGLGPNDEQASGIILLHNEQLRRQRLAQALKRNRKTAARPQPTYGLRLVQ